MKIIQTPTLNVPFMDSNAEHNVNILFKKSEIHKIRTPSIKKLSFLFSCLFIYVTYLEWYWLLRKKRKRVEMEIPEHIKAEVAVVDKSNGNRERK